MKKALIILFFVCGSVFAEITGIANFHSSVDKITKSEIRSLYLMKKRRTNNGQQMTIYQLPQNSTLHRMFVTDVLKMSFERYTQEYDSVTNSGLGTFINLVSSRQDMVNKVSLTENSIGYIDSDYLILNNGNNDVKLLKIID